MEGNPKQNDDLPRAFLDLLGQNPNRLLAALLINELVKRGVTKYYLSPGHRNAPLIAAILHHPITEMESIIDERSAGYHALGYTAGSGKCPALVCTSGTALANYYPALIEANSSDLPLLVISADRPWQQVEAGTNQTIVQTDIYGRFAPSLVLDKCGCEHLSRLPPQLDNLLKNRLPCHINIPFEEPLGSEQAPIDDAITKKALSLLNNFPASIDPPSGKSPKTIELTESIYQSKSPLIVIGEIKSLDERRALIPLLKETSLPFFLDVTSGIKYQFPMRGSRAIPSFEHPEVAEYLKGNIDTILHLGGRVISRNYYKFLQSNPDIDVLSVSSSVHRRDPALRTRQFLRCSPHKVFPSLLQRPPLKQWDTLWMEEKIRKVSHSPLSFPQVSKTLVEIIPEGVPLFLGNSTAIRAFDNFLSFDLSKDVPVYYNRGVSGIEGHIASALGIAEGTGRMTTAVMGDVSFLHDIGSLSSIPDSHPGLIIVLVNDGGGGIFNLLPTAKEKAILPYMSTPHSLRFKDSAQQFGLPYRTAKDTEELIRSYRSLLEHGKGLLEVILDPIENRDVYQQLKTLRGPHVLP